MRKKKEWLKEAIRKLRSYAWNHEGKCENGWDNLKKLAYRVNNKHRRNVRMLDRKKKVMPTGRGRPRKPVPKGKKRR